jgi:NAD(P)-dependent dehydrogenase (short-subunit alcohol dehydrogenase family)
MAKEDDMGLAGKVAIVTGGGAAEGGIGNGKAAAILLARAGCKVVVADRDKRLAEETAAIIAKEGNTGSAIAADVTSERECAAVVKAAMDRYGRLDVLDNNVGIAHSATVLEETLDRWETMMRVSVTSMFLMSKHAIPAMVAGGQGGAIVNISSISALRPRGLTAYSTAKGAIISFTRALAVDHGPAGIRVNCVAPGPVYTPLVYAGGKMTPEGRERRRESSLTGTEGTGWDIGNAVVFLASDRARYITGHTLVVDGGATLTSRRRDG